MLRLTKYLVFLLGLAMSTSVWSEVPKVLHYQGYLTDEIGTPIHCPSLDDCNVEEGLSMTFRLYTSLDGEQAFWTETYEFVEITQGVFNLSLGTTTTLDAEDLNTGEAYLGVSINAKPELSPRQHFVSAAFAIRADTAAIAQDADSLGGISAENFVTADEVGDLCVTEDDLNAKGYCPECYSDADVTTYLTENGYTPGPGFSGSFFDLDDVPIALSSLSTDGSGSLTYNENAIINTSGEWVGPTAGLAGLNSAVATAIEPPGENCTSGGVKINSGPDADSNGVLDGAEVTNTAYVCNGSAGVKGDKGDVGGKGDQGNTGDTGPQGTKGNAGVDVVSAEVNVAGELVVVLSDGSKFTSASLIGPQGLIGATGSQGGKGDTGNDGVDVVSAEANVAGELVVVLSDGSIFTSASLIGPQGVKGDTGATGPKGDAGDPAPGGFPAPDYNSGWFTATAEITLTHNLGTRNFSHVAVEGSDDSFGTFPTWVVGVTSSGSGAYGAYVQAISKNQVAVSSGPHGHMYVYETGEAAWSNVAKFIRVRIWK